MEDQLKGIDDKERFRASLLLSDLLQKNIPIDETIFHNLILFFCNRLADYPSVVPVYLFITF